MSLRTSGIDYSSTATWMGMDKTAILDRVQTDVYVHQNKEYREYVPGAAKVAGDIYAHLFAAPDKRARFFCNCETLGLKGTRLRYAYEHTHSNLDFLVQLVLDKDKEMVAAVHKRKIIQ